MAKRKKYNPLDAAAENKWENKYGSNSKPKGPGYLSEGQKNYHKDQKNPKVSNPTQSMTRYAGGETRRIYVNGKAVGRGGKAASTALNSLLKNVGHATY